jgi:hypothetical protein
MVTAVACQSADKQRERAAAKVVRKHFKDTGVDPEKIYRKDQNGEHTILSYNTGDIEGGRAVHILGADAAYWVKDNQVYVVDDNARKLSPDLDQAPDSISRQSILAVAD